MVVIRRVLARVMAIPPIELMMSDSQIYHISALVCENSGAENGAGRGTRPVPTPKEYHFTSVIRFVSLNTPASSR